VLSGVMEVDDIQRYVVAGNKSKLVYLHPRCAAVNVLRVCVCTCIHGAQAGCVWLSVVWCPALGSLRHRSVYLPVHPSQIPRHEELVRLPLCMWDTVQAHRSSVSSPCSAHSIVLLSACS
jgi:hypothetical protein